MKLRRRLRLTRAQIIKDALAEVGTTEKPAGSNKVKYNTWYYGKEVSGSAYPWCAAFVCWLFKKEPQKILRSASCSAILNDYTKRGQVVKTPEPGDIVFFKFSKGTAKAEHIGIVVEVKGNTVITVEGNTSFDDKGSQDNGGAVAKRTRKSCIVAYARPIYDEEPQKEPDRPVIKYKDTGSWVRILQGKLIILGYKTMGVKCLGTFDIFTERAVKDFQTKHNLDVDGVVGPETWAALYK